MTVTQRLVVVEIQLWFPRRGESEHGSPILNISLFFCTSLTPVLRENLLAQNPLRAEYLDRISIDTDRPPTSGLDVVLGPLGLTVMVKHLKVH